MLESQQLIDKDKSVQSDSSLLRIRWPNGVPTIKAIIIVMNNKMHLEKQPNLKQMTTQQLKSLLAKLEDQHDTLEAKNEELTMQISDLRNAVKCVENQRKDNVAYEIQKKKELQNKIDSLQKGLKYANKNNSYEIMEKYKAVMQ